MAVDDIRLSNGVRALLSTRTEAPVVSVHVVIRWKSPAPVHRLALQAVLLDGVPKQGKSLRKTMAELGVAIKVDKSQSFAQVFEFVVPSVRLESSLTAVFDSLSRPMSSVENVDALRAGFKPYNLKGAPALLDRIEETLYSPGHPYHDQVRPPEPTLLRFDDVVRFRDTELRPETITICAVGNVSRDTMEPMLNRVAMGFTALPAPPDRKLPAKPTYSSGLFLWDAAVEDAAGAIVIPAVPLGDPEYAAFNLASRIVRKLIETDGSRDGDDADFDLRFYPGEAYLAIIISGDTSRVSGLAHDIVGAMKRVALGDFPPTLLEEVRREVTFVAIERAESLQYVGETFAESVVHGGPPDIAVKIYNESLDTSREAVVAAAQKWLRTSAIRIAAAGDVPGLKIALADLDIRPVTLVSPKGKK